MIITGRRTTLPSSVLVCIRRDRARARLSIVWNLELNHRNLILSRGVTVFRRNNDFINAQKTNKYKYIICTILYNRNNHSVYIYISTNRLLRRPSHLQSTAWKTARFHFLLIFSTFSRPPRSFVSSP